MSWRRWLPAAGWAAIVFTLTSIPNPDLPQLSGGDKVAHTIMYGVLAALVAVALADARRRLGPMLLTLVILSAIAAADEWHQLFIPGRTASTADWVADIGGAGTALLISGVAARRRELKR